MNRYGTFFALSSASAFPSKTKSAPFWGDSTKRGTGMGSRPQKHLKHFGTELAQAEGERVGGIVLLQQAVFRASLLVLRSAALRLEL